jgi:hypothetical protein
MLGMSPDFAMVGAGGVTMVVYPPYAATPVFYLITYCGTLFSFAY